MKRPIGFVLFMIFSLSGFAQSLDEKLRLFNHADLYHQLSFDINIELDSNANLNNSFVLLNDLDIKTIKFNSEELNAKLFSNIDIVENTYLNHEEFLRGCGYLEDGITNPIDSASLMFSMVLNNFVNNVLLTKGIFAKR